MATQKSSGSRKTSSGRKYSRGASENVETEMSEMKQGKLRSGSGRKVTNPKQAIAIGLSEARKSGEKVPEPPKESASARKTKTSTRSASHRSTTSKSNSGRKSTGTKTSAEKSRGTRTKRSVSSRKSSSK